jgi:hypothetical protein
LNNQQIKRNSDLAAKKPPPKPQKCKTEAARSSVATAEVDTPQKRKAVAGPVQPDPQTGYMGPCDTSFYTGGALCIDCNQERFCSGVQTVDLSPRVPGYIYPLTGILSDAVSGLPLAIPGTGAAALPLTEVNVDICSISAKNTVLTSFGSLYRTGGLNIINVTLTSPTITAISLGLTGADVCIYSELYYGFPIFTVPNILFGNIYYIQNIYNIDFTLSSYFI